MKYLPIILSFLLLGNVHAGLDNGLLAYYKFTKCSGADSVGGAPLTKHGTPQCVATPAGKGMEFQGGGDYWVSQSSSGISFSTGASISALIKPSSLGNLGAPLINAWVNAHEDKMLSIQADNRIYFYMFNCMDGRGLSSISPIAPDRWTHVVGTYDGEHARIYIDGILNSIGPVKSGCSIGNSNGRLYIGQNPERGDGYPFYGGLDEVRIYDRALSEKDVRRLSSSYQ